MSHHSRLHVAFKKTWHFTVGKERIHPLEETGIKDIGLVHDETNLLALTSAASEHSTKIIVEILCGVASVDLDLEDRKTIHPGDES